MGKLFNMDEVFAIAVQIENNGAKFYRTVAAKQTDTDNKAYLEKLAGMEDEHERIFQEMRSEVATTPPAGESTDVYDEGGLYLSAIAGGYQVEGAPTVTEALSGDESLQEILRIAIDLEKKSILFYLGLKDVVPERLGKDKIDRIIDEEKSHVVILTQELR